MAKTSSINQNNFRKALVERKKSGRAALKKIIMDKTTDFDVRMQTVFKLAEKQRNASKVRVRNRCMLTGRPRGYYRKFGISRVALRDLASFGLLPGVTKASW